MANVSNVSCGTCNTYVPPPPHETTYHTGRTGPSTGRHPDDGIHNTHQYRREVRRLSASTSGPWDLTRTAPPALGPGSIYRSSRGGEDTGESEKGGGSSPSVLAGEI